MKRTYVPAKPRNKKLIGGMMVASGGTGGTASLGTQHSHANKDVIDRLTQLNIDVLSHLSLYQTGVEMEPLLDEYGQPVLDVNGDPVMVPVETPVLDEFGQPVLDINGDPVTEQIPIYAIRSTASFFSEKEVSAYGIGEEGDGGGGYDMLLSWANYDTDKEQWVISAALGKGLHDRVTTLEAGGAGGSTVEWGAESGGYIPLTVEGVSKSVALTTHTHSEYALTTHNHNGVYEPVFSKNTAFNKNFGTTSGTVVQGNDSRIALGQIAYGWGNHASAGYATFHALYDYVTLATAQTITGAKTFSAALTASTSVSTPILNLGNGWTIEAGTSKIEVKQSGTVRARFESTGFVSTGEITAYS